jgi:hypothetical protein
VVAPYQASWAAKHIKDISSGTNVDDGPVQDTHRVDMCTHIRGVSMDLPRTGAAELVVAQEGRYVVIVVAGAAVLAGTSACTVCPGMAKLRLSRTV